jgi:hypothetical protein
MQNTLECGEKKHSMDSTAINLRCRPHISLQRKTHYGCHSDKSTVQTNIFLCQEALGGKTKMNSHWQESWNQKINFHVKKRWEADNHFHSAARNAATQVIIFYSRKAGSRQKINFHSKA